MTVRASRSVSRHIGTRPIAASGNSDGDVQMLQHMMEGQGRRLGTIVRHDDAQREFANDRDSHIGCRARALDEVPARGWQLASMRED